MEAAVPQQTSIKGAKQALGIPSGALSLNKGRHTTRADNALHMLSTVRC